MTTTLKGVDVSHWQSGIKLGNLTGVRFAIMKATEGVGYVDPLCDALYSQAKAAGLLRGVYHFYRGGGASEADYFLRNVSGYVGDALLALDFEDTKYQHDVKGAKAFLDRVRSKTGVRPVVYMNYSFLKGSDWSPVVAADYGLWLARYGSETGSITPWKTLTLWQYTSTGRVSGYAGNLDLNRFYGDADTWRAYAKGTSSTPDHDDAGDDDAPAVKVPHVDVDGVWGSGTIRQRQALLTNAGWYGGQLDGTHDHQNPAWKAPNPGLGSGWDWDSGYAGKGGSSTVRADQTRLARIKGKDGKPLYRGAVDGLAGDDYFRALQREHQTPVDGVVSRPSSVVKAMQSAGNRGEL